MMRIRQLFHTAVRTVCTREILEPAIVRWLYIRRNPNQAFTIDFGKEVLRLYDRSIGKERLLELLVQPSLLE